MIFKHFKPSLEKIRFKYTSEKNDLWSEVWFSWVYQLISRGRRKPLLVEDLLPLNPQEEPFRHTHSLKPNHIILSLILEHKKALMLGSLFAAVTLLCQLSIPFLLKGLIDTFGHSKWETIAPAGSGLPWIAGLFLCTLGGSLFTHHMWHILLRMCMRVKAQITHQLYQKTLHISHEYSPTKGDVVNLMASDSARIYNVLAQAHQLWSIPLQVGVVVYFLYRLLGWPAWGGVGILALLLPISAAAARKQSGVRRTLLQQADKRVSAIGDILQAIKLIKLNAWEDQIFSKLNVHRKHEEKTLLRLGHIQASLTFLFLGTPIAVAFTALTLCFYFGSKLSVGEIFSAITLFGLLRQPLSQLPSLVSDLTDSILAQRRIAQFLLKPEVSSFPKFEEPTAQWESGFLHIKSTELSYANDPNEQDIMPEGEPLKKWTLRVPELTFSPGELVFVTGSVGSGKSTLLRYLLGDHGLYAGPPPIHPSLRAAYVPQQPWIMSGTIEDNLVWDSTDPQLPTLNEVLRLCALGPDLESWPCALKTQVGEKGVLLSGGQKQRLALARAAYAACHLVVLDDPLSALDHKVADAVFRQLILDFWSNKTRILTTHRHEFLKYADRILTIENGYVRECSNAERAAKGWLPLPHSMTTPVQPPGAFEANTAPLAEAHSLPPIQDTSTTEEVETGAVKAFHFKKYVKRMGPPATLITLILIFFGRDALSMWADHMVADFNKGNNTPFGSFVLGYGAVALLAVTLGWVRSLLLSRGCLNAASAYHFDLLKSVLYTHLSFFQNTHVGRILNRFSKDTEAIDRTIPQAMAEASLCFVTLASTLILIVVVIPAAFFFLIPAVIFYFFVQKNFRKVARQIKRLDSVSRSPLMSHVSESLDGRALIRAYGKVPWACQKLFFVLQTNQRAFYSAVSLNRWLGVRLELTSSLFVCCVALSFVLLPHFASSATIGLCITYALLMTGNLNWTVRMLAELENGFNAVERVHHYTLLPPEPQPAPPADLPAHWPTRGHIEVHHLSATYPNQNDPTLKDISFSLQPHEHMGIIGRTGSGKTTLAQAFFRLVPCTAGDILVDGFSLFSIAPRRVRAQLGMIPQDPQLFMGTLRDNIDPLSEFSDAQIWQSLETTSLAHKVKQGAKGLDLFVSEGGLNWSVGERQLLCLARAFLKRPRILFLDEATAHVDPATDQLVHDLVEDMARHSTLIVVAHRLQTVERCHKILWLDQGTVKAWGPTQDVLEAFKKPLAPGSH